METCLSASLLASHSQSRSLLYLTLFKTERKQGVKMKVKQEAVNIFHGQGCEDIFKC